MQQIIHRTPDQAAGEPPEQATRLQVQQIRLTPTVKDFMRADRAGTDVTGCSRTSTGRMISEPLQLDILTIEQHYRRNTEQQENKCFSGIESGSRYRDHSREGRARKGLFISGWGYSCRKYRAFTGGRTEGQKRFIL